LREARPLMSESGDIVGGDSDCWLYS